MNWKDFFYYTRSQKNGIYVLLFLLLSLIAANFYLDKLFSSKLIVFEVNDSILLKDFVVVESKGEVYKNWESASPKNTYTKIDAKKELRNFNPNNVSSFELQEMGFSTYCIRNIMKYREKGGVYRSKKQFSNLYGLSASEYKRIEPYLVFDEKPKIDVEYSEKNVNRQSVELNTADTTALKKLRGIGSVFARRIVAYRNKLGGYVSVNQLSEVYGLTHDQLASMDSFIKVDTTRIRPIEVNIASVIKLKSHPYINFYQAKAIYEFRKSHSSPISFEQLYEILDTDINAEFLRKIKPYLSFKQTTNDD